jgi:hypothetical protein
MGHNEMKKRRQVFLFGKSVILRTVGASLQQYPDLEITTLSPPLPGTAELQALAPDVIIFDLQASQPVAAFTLLEAFPSLMLIGIDPSSEQVFLWTGKHMSALSAQDLAQSIRMFTSDQNHPSVAKEEDHESTRKEGKIP